MKRLVVGAAPAGAAAIMLPRFAPKAEAMRDHCHAMMRNHCVASSAGCDAAFRVETLEDMLRPRLRAVCIGINLAPTTVRAAEAAASISSMRRAREARLT